MPTSNSRSSSENLDMREEFRSGIETAPEGELFSSEDEGAQVALGVDLSLAAVTRPPGYSEAVWHEMTRAPQ